MIHEDTDQLAGHQYVGAPKLVRAIRIEFTEASGQVKHLDVLQAFAEPRVLVDRYGHPDADVTLCASHGFARCDGKFGDWLAKDEDGRVLLIPAEVFNARYQRVADTFDPHNRTVATEDQTPQAEFSWLKLVADVPTDARIPGYHGYVRTKMGTESVTTAFLPLALLLRTLWRLYVWAKAGPDVPLDPHEAFVEGYQIGQSEAHQGMVDLGVFDQAEMDRAQDVRAKEQDL